MASRRAGFTLIELLIVIVIIGILATIALPKFNATRERAYFNAMMSDLRNLNTQQELYYTRPQNHYTYAGSLASLPEFTHSPGVTVTVSEASGQGWVGVAAHAALRPRQQCGIVIGTVGSMPVFLSTPGVVTCTGN